MFRIKIPLLLIVALAASSDTLAQGDRTPLFPSRFGLDKRWEVFKQQPLTSSSFAAMLKEDPDGGKVVLVGEARYQSIWTVLQRQLLQNPQLLTELRQAQERACQALVEEAAGDLDKLMPAARRFPWADTVHQTLYESGLQELRRGNFGRAGRSFQDVFVRSADADLRGRAQVGAILAAAHEPHSGVFAAAFEGLDPKAVFRLAGEDLSAAALRARLAPKGGTPAFDLKSLEKRTLEAPSSASWIYERPGIHGEGVTVGGPSLLAWFDGAQAKPKWTQTSPLAVAPNLFGTLVPGPFVPSVHSTRLYTRWGMQALAKKLVSGAVPVDIAAFDTSNGRLLWSAASNPDWQELAPVNDPTFADGRLFVLAVTRTQEYSPIYLVCLDAETGRLLWKRELAQNHTTRPGLPRVNLSRFGNAVTVSSGLVYCSTSMGLVACCDARDGLIEWLRTYPQDREAAVNRRLGSAPIPVGSRVIFLPRDASATFSLDKDSGELHWLKTDDAATALGIFEQTLVLAAPGKIAARQIDTGNSAWERPLPEPFDHRAFLSGPSVFVGMPGKLLRLDVKTGAIAEERTLEKSDPAGGLAPRGGTLFGVRLSARTITAAPSIGLGD